MAESRTRLAHLASWRAQSTLRLARDGGLEALDVHEPNRVRCEADSPHQGAKMVVKKPGRRAGTVSVKFSLPDTPAKTVHLAGEFSEWRPVNAMRRRRGETWELTLNLGANRAYEFRYVIDGHEWVNDPAPDRYVENPFGGENSVVIT
jgi:1,4-alpha-glucan branching enzyme